MFLEKDDTQQVRSMDGFINALSSNLHKSRRVLIVDDDLDASESIKFIVESYGNSACDIVTDPYEALLRLSDHHYDLAFIDQKMPGLNGTDVLTKLDNAVQLDPLIADTRLYDDAVPVVLMSGSKINLSKSYKLKNFRLLDVIHKKDLLKFLSLNFAS